MSFDKPRGDEIAIVRSCRKQRALYFSAADIRRCLDDEERSRITLQRIREIMRGWAANPICVVHAAGIADPRRGPWSITPRHLVGERAISAVRRHMG